jgi:hypothetical protein
MLRNDFIVAGLHFNGACLIKNKLSADLCCFAWAPPVYPNSLSWLYLKTLQVCLNNLSRHAVSLADDEPGFDRGCLGLQ